LKAVTARTRRPAHVKPGFKQGPRKRPQRVGLSPWFAHGLERLRAFAKREGHARVPARHYEGAFGLGFWVSARRAQHRAGALTPERVRLLENVPGWSWDPVEDLFQQTVAAMKDFVRQEGHAFPPRRSRFRGSDLGAWATDLRVRRKRGLLSPERERILESIPGWSWAPKKQGFDEGLTLLLAFAKERGHTRIPASYRRAGFALGTWAAKQRNKYRSGRLPQADVRRLERVPGWTWAPLEDRFQVGLRLLKQFAKEVGHARVPKDHVVDQFPLGQWVDVRRLDYRGGTLSLPHRRLLEAVPGWSWFPTEVKFQEGLEKLREFRKRHGHVRVPYACVMRGFRLGLWFSSVRAQHRRGTLAPHKRQLLEAVPGWSWPQSRQS
jgi:hypothetical protein